MHGLLLTLLAFADDSIASNCNDEGDLSVTFLANEGFLLRSGETGVVIDAFVVERFAGYGALPDELASALRSASAPFDSVRLALASHVHRDHFQPEPAGEFLSAAPQAQLTSTPQVLEALREAYGKAAMPGERITEVLPAPGAVSRLSHAGITVEVLNLSHGRRSKVDNLGHVIELGGWRILHVGDAEPFEDSYAPYALAGRGVDLSLIPYWYFQGDEGRRIVASHLRAPRMIAAHIPPEEAQDVRHALAGSHPDVTVPSAPGESWCLGGDGRPANPS